MPVQRRARHRAEQHPDWPGTWAEAGGHSRPVCAVFDSGDDDATKYDLVLAQEIVWRTTATTAAFPEAVREIEEVVPVNVSTWVLSSGVTVGR